MVLVLYRFEGKWNCLIKQSFILSADTGIGLVAEGSGGTIANSLFVGSTQTRSQDQNDDQQLNSIARLEGGVGGNLMQDNLFQCQVTWQKCENLRPGNLMINAWRCTRGVGSEVHSWWMASHQCQVHQLWLLWPHPCWRQPYASLVSGLEQCLEPGERCLTRVIMRHDLTKQKTITKTRPSRWLVS